MNVKWFVFWLPFIMFTVLIHLTAFSTNTHTVAAQNTTGDRLALLTIKSMIKHDPHGVMTSWNDSSTSFCQWQGVTCSTRDQRVVVLDLSSRGLIGNIPAAVTNCSKLQVLQLGGNLLVGKIPDGFGSLSMLRILILHSNILEGGIPRYIANLTSLETLSFGMCQLGGTLPDVFHRLTNLSRLAMHGNNLVGTIPPSLYNSSSLVQVFLDHNRFTGTLPEDLGSTMPRLGTLSINVNQLYGPLPPSILSSPQLQVLDVAQNNFSGKLVITPRNSCNLVIMSLSLNRFGTGEEDEMKFMQDLSICGRLGYIDLSYNQLQGLLPDSLGNLSTTLYHINVASNHFSGVLPSSIGNLSGLTLLDLSSNQLSGSLPVTIGNLKNLQRLNLTNNSFSGNIPSSLGNLELMVDMFLTLNEFNGTIPSSLGNCKRLIKLDLDRNNFTGGIPRELFQLRSLSISLNLGNNQLSGPLPAEVGNLNNVNEIILANNRLSGNIPSSISSCVSLQILNISNNLFSGSLPESLGSLRALEDLDVSSNNITGAIPNYLEVIPLKKLDISFNNLQGEVPRKGVFANTSSVLILGNNQLCGGLPEFRLPKCQSNKKKNKLSVVVILAISVGSVMLFVAMVVMFIACYSRKTEVENDPPETASTESIVQVSYETLYKATEGFSTKNLIGEGSFSTVYKGFLDTDGVNNIVAIKVLNLHRQGGSKSFISECEVLRNTRHRNLTKVITCCSGTDFQGNEFKAIVYEFMPNGSLDKWLHNPVNELHQLTLAQIVNIMLDVIHALDYLHHHAGKTIVHCDLKPSNILLNEDMVAHVGDFGLSKILESEYQSRYNSSSAGVRGTIGYAAPEYGVGSKVSTNGDMYSYGILLLEMMTCKKPTDVMFGEELSLHNYAKESLGDGALDIIDPVLLKDDMKNAANKEESTGYLNHEMCLRLLLEIGVSCSMESPLYRMDTANVIQELQLIKDAILGD
ncbi:hypothetical protein M8C21_006814 [Ambrosia artemisiifolia]|uniref:non-specific serine/threonine protein kinase n=1 Tax=Ambrosia artemisiifolia TaxID=4212 RepID=A0AAD5GMJ0_AMBAR|nr:hypothetical protein M8C21_006814 [Ambrosia artemisiifolia]